MDFEIKFEWEGQGNLFKVLRKYYSKEIDELIFERNAIIIKALDQGYVIDELNIVAS